MTSFAGKLSMLGALVSLVLLSGCGEVLSKNKTWNAMGLSFEYPKYLKAVHQSFDHESDANIFVTAETVEDFVRTCLNDEDSEDMKERNEGIRKSFKLGIEAVKKQVDREDLRTLDNVGCGLVVGNVYHEFVKVGDYDGVIFHRALSNDIYASLSSFVTQLLVLGEHGTVYTLTFKYDFDELGKYFASHDEGYSEVKTTQKQSDEVMKFFSDGDPITSSELKGFEANKQTILDVIHTVEIDDSFEIKSAKDPIVELDQQKANAPPSSEDDVEESSFKEAFMNITNGSGTQARSSNNASYIFGETSDNCSRITVEAKNETAGMTDLYELEEYRYGDVTFKYGVREDWNNVASGQNSYLFKAFCDGDQVKTATYSLQSTPKIQPAYIPTPTYTNDYYTNSAGKKVQSPTYSLTVPAGATAKCGDGTYSFSQSRSGTCSHHGGVDYWL